MNVVRFDLGKEVDMVSEEVSESEFQEDLAVLKECGCEALKREIFGVFSNSMVSIYDCDDGIWVSGELKVPQLYLIGYAYMLETSWETKWGSTKVHNEEIRRRLPNPFNLLEDSLDEAFEIV